MRPASTRGPSIHLGRFSEARTRPPRCSRSRAMRAPRRSRSPSRDAIEIAAVISASDSPTSRELPAGRGLWRRALKRDALQGSPLGRTGTSEAGPESLCMDFNAQGARAAGRGSLEDLALSLPQRLTAPAQGRASFPSCSLSSPRLSMSPLTKSSVSTANAPSTRTSPAASRPARVGRLHFSARARTRGRDVERTKLGVPGGAANRHRLGAPLVDELQTRGDWRRS